MCGSNDLDRLASKFIIPYTGIHVSMVVFVADHFQQALAWQHIALTMDEVECMVANMIYRGYVKGYIAHARHILVCSKVAPFPPLKSANVSDLL